MNNRSHKGKLEELSKRIRQARKEARISQVELGRAVGVSDKAISSYEKGRSTPSFAKLKKIAQATEHSLTYFSNDEKAEDTITNKLSKIEEQLAQIRKLLKNNITS